PAPESLDCLETHSSSLVRAGAKGHAGFHLQQNSAARFFRKFPRRRNDETFSYFYRLKALFPSFQPVFVWNVRPFNRLDASINARDCKAGMDRRKDHPRRLAAFEVGRYLYQVVCFNERDCPDASKLKQQRSRVFERAGLQLDLE